jgi:hypothetical protein
LKQFIERNEWYRHLGIIIIEVQDFSFKRIRIFKLLFDDQQDKSLEKRGTAKAEECQFLFCVNQINILQCENQ